MTQSVKDALADAETLRRVHDSTHAMGNCWRRYDAQNWGSCCGIIEAQKHRTDTASVLFLPDCRWDGHRIVFLGDSIDA